MNELEELGVELVMVSIGTPKNGKKLVEHLAVPNLEDYFFVDPENTLYDSLKLNKGVKDTFFSTGTAFSFLRRFTKQDGMTELNEVLSKWNEAFFIPPRQDQAFNQGGTFIFDGDQTVFAHYDEGTGAHSDIQEVIDYAKGRIMA
jgi:hypothetical protein